MSGRDYLTAIKKELAAGRHQHRMGENILAAFGYVRRRQTAIDEINKALDDLELQTDPPIGPDMPLRVPRIRFSLKAVGTPPQAIDEEPVEPEPEDVEQQEEGLPESLETLVPAFRIAELDAADQPVDCIAPDAPLSEAYTRMALRKYSQLVVGNGNKPRRQDIKGIVSYQSIAKALLTGQPTTVRECVDDSIPVLRSEADLKDVVPLLGVHDVVLVVGSDQRLQGIVTAWDLAEEFAQLVDPFKRIGEVEGRLTALLNAKLGKDRIHEFLLKNPPSVPSGDASGSNGDGLTIGDLQRIFEHPDYWANLGLKGVHKSTFTDALERTRLFRNRLMHFRDPLTAEEAKELTNFCDIVREIKF